MMSATAPWIRRTLTRLLLAVTTLVVVTITVFLALHLLKGGYANIYLGTTATQDQVAALNHQYGLDAPLMVQLWRWLLYAVRGDFGTSLVSGQPVSSVLALRLPVTAELALYASALAVIVGLPVGVLIGTAGRLRKSATGLRAASALSVSLPDFVVGSVLVYLLTRFAPSYLSVGSYIPFTANPAVNLRQMFFPAATLALFPAAILVRTLRDSIQSVMAEPYIHAAALRGEDRRQIVRRHILRNSSLPALTVSAVNFGYLLGGAVIVENVFGLPGMGQELINSINARDYAVVQAGIVVGAGAFIAINMVSDSIYGLIDPRLRVRGVN
jgi:peptide/nickel transport system permease protein